jgi:hypothetical protein
MDKKLDEMLVKNFPNLYRDRYKNMRETAMCWGFPNSGWFPLIWDLSEKLEAEILKLPENKREHCCASQVKEKFGGLRFYMTTETEKMDRDISEAVGKSFKTCEVCGLRGRERDGGWILTLCDKHANDKNAEGGLHWWPRLKFTIKHFRII